MVMALLTLEQMLVQNILDNTRVPDCHDQANNLLLLVCIGRVNNRRGKISNEKKWSIPSSAAALTRQYVSILQWNLFSCWALKAELNNN